MKNLAAPWLGLFLTLPPQLPPLSDADRFPPVSVASLQVKFCNCRLVELRQQWATDCGNNDAYWDDLVEDATWRLKVWDIVEDVGRQVYLPLTGWDWEHQTRLNLARLKRILGDKAYWAGELPSPAPTGAKP
jgi:hypothetical protein